MASAMKPKADETTAMMTEEERAEQDADADEMPLLFMDGLPSVFQQNAQLAALATFMADSDDDDDDEGGGDDHAQQTAGNQRSAARLRQAKRRFKTPYARPAASESKREAADGDSKRKGTKKQADATKELQLFLSMFKV